MMKTLEIINTIILSANSMAIIAMSVYAHKVHKRCKLK
jgi:hypothetical protein